LSVSACVKKITDTANKIATTGSMTANAGGKSYTAGATRATKLTNSLSISGTDAGSDERMDLKLDNYSTGKTKYTIELMSNQASYYDTKSHSALYGVVELQTAGDKNAKGTFSFTTTDSMKVTGGSFEVSWE
jgi:hypothetical protein